MGNGMNNVLPRLYIGSYQDSQDVKQLTVNGITHILSALDGAKPCIPGVRYLCLPLADNLRQDIASYFPQCIEFIHDARITEGNVLVHCHAGVSRSATVVVAYLMTVSQLCWQDALRAVKGARSFVNPNFHFQQQLEQFERSGDVTEQRARLDSLYGRSDLADAIDARKLIEVYQLTSANKKCSTTDYTDIIPLLLNSYGGWTSSTRSSKMFSQSSLIDKPTPVASIGSALDDIICHPEPSAVNNTEMMLNLSTKTSRSSSLPLQVQLSTVNQSTLSGHPVMIENDDALIMWSNNTRPRSYHASELSALFTANKCLSVSTKSLPEYSTPDSAVVVSPISADLTPTSNNLMTHQSSNIVHFCPRPLESKYGRLKPSQATLDSFFSHSSRQPHYTGVTENALVEKTDAEGFNQMSFAMGEDFEENPLKDKSVEDEQPVCLASANDDMDSTQSFSQKFSLARSVMSCVDDNENLQEEMGQGCCTSGQAHETSSDSINAIGHHYLLLHTRTWRELASLAMDDCT